MRKIVYSSVIKLIAVILFVTSIVFGTLRVTDGIVKFNEENHIYSFESDFSDSWFVSNLLNGPEYAVIDAYYNCFRESDNNVYPADPEIYMAENGEKIANNIKQGLDDLYYSDKINYFVQWNDMVFTNCGAASPEELMQGDYYSYIKRDSSGDYENRSAQAHHSSFAESEYLELFDTSSTFIISSNIKQEAVDEYKAIWERQESIVSNTFVETLVCAISALLLLIYLFCVCGKNENGEYKNMWIDNIWVEIHLAAIAGGGVGAVTLCVVALDDYISGYLPHNLIDLVMVTSSALGSLIIITSLLSIIRNIKTRRLVQTSIILRVLGWLLRIFVKAARWIWRKTKAFWGVVFRMLSKKTGVILIGMLLVYTALMVFLGMGMIWSPIWLILSVVLFVFACFVVACRAKDLDEVKKGVGEVRGGNVAYKIPKLKCDDMRILASNINDIAKGLDESVSEKVKAERLKTELITNVSHDLKTPITSIISYTELLSKTEGLSEEAKDYVSVIAKKSDRLKRLTQDLFDISKVQSGNDDVIFEKLDVGLLINQALGEHDNEIQSSGLPFCVEAPKDLYIAADGRKMSRVVSNLINNILKYSMKNTRVFITAAERDGKVIMEFKNISAYPLNFNVDEITGRFVRGDESRTTDGNGLGLAIAKSYTEICNGSFEIVVDGDMFKAILKFEKYIPY